MILIKFYGGLMEIQRITGSDVVKNTMSTDPNTTLQNAPVKEVEKSKVEVVNEPNKGMKIDSYA